MATTTGAPCKEPSCERKKHPGKHRCSWHYLMTLSMDEQVSFAQRRLELKQKQDDFVHRSRVPAAQWPAGTRFCAGCQCFIPTFYASGSRCKACASRAAHAGHVERTYDITAAEYDALLAWQGGRCAICGKQPRGRRLAVDHDHASGLVRGLLCANDEWGCNMSLRILLDSLEIAQRALAYVEQPPLDRMRSGQPPLFVEEKRASWRDVYFPPAPLSA